MMKCEEECESTLLKELSPSEKLKLEAQNSRLISPFQAQCLESQAKKHWDLFYKRNENRFFKDRHWTTREFKELADFQEGEKRRLLELGCGTGNLVYPLLEEGLAWEVWVCDISPRALSILQTHPLFSPNVIHTLEADITQPGCLQDVREMDVVTAVFVLSTLGPDKVKLALGNAYDALRPGGLLLVRDYARWDMTQLRFAPGRKISDNFYARQDGTRSYFFTMEELEDMCVSVGFKKVRNVYVNRRTINKKEGVDAPRVFVQGKFIKPQVHHSTNIQTVSS